MKSIIIQNKNMVTFKCRGQEDAYRKAAQYCDVDEPFSQYLVRKNGKIDYIGGLEK